MLQSALPVLSCVFLATFPAAGQGVRVDAAQQKLYGVETASLQPAEITPSVKGRAEVIDPLPLLQQWSALTMAQLAAEVAHTEATRTETLNREGQLASDRAMEDARQRAATADEAVRQAELSLSATWGAEALQGLKSQSWENDLRLGKSVLIRLSLPAGTQFPDHAKTASVSPLAFDESLEMQEFPALTHWSDPRVNASRQPGYYLLVHPESSGWPIGTPLQGTVQTSDKTLQGFNLPADAILITQGRAWVFQEGESDHFELRPISTRHATRHGWFVEANALDAHQPLVIRGAQGLLSQKIQASSGPKVSD
ncbi:hypothetical protein HNR46_001001 [Haloferula luteola]|uniref:Uncharacterized protein n=1 Tax=Haloferula luteola TaxID=595692 RepID=A0A840UX85_9BACT|nr:hypothetical protein [Haloferula luteola]MBB5350767.1 hypothetical protein [Haloferula luteola]